MVAEKEKGQVQKLGGAMEDPRRSVVEDRGWKGEGRGFEQIGRGWEGDGGVPEL